MLLCKPLEHAKRGENEERGKGDAKKCKLDHNEEFCTVFVTVVVLQIPKNEKMKEEGGVTDG